MKSNKINDNSKLQKLAGPKVEQVESNGKLSLEELRKCEGFENVSDTEGLEIIDSLYKLSMIAFNYSSPQ